MKNFTFSTQLRLFVGNLLNFNLLSLIAKPAKGLRSFGSFRFSGMKSLNRALQRSLQILLLIHTLMGTGMTGWGQTLSDNATNSAYNSGWNNGTNGGTGFAAWSLSSDGGSAGHFKGDPAGNGMGTTGIGTSAFGMYGHSSQYAYALRDFSSSMGVGDELTFYWGMNWDCGTSGSKGWELKSGNTVIFGVNNSNTATITYNGAASGTVSSNYGTTPMLITVTRTSSTQYSVSITRRNTSEGTFSTTISSSSAIDNIRFYIGAQETNAGERNMYFNAFQIKKPDQYRSAASGNWGTAATWEISTNGGSTWSDAGTAPGSTLYSTITIRSPHTISQNQNYSSGSNNNIVVESGGTLNMTGATGTFQFNTLSVSGTVSRNNTNAYSGAITINNGGKYVHAVNGGSVPTCTWNSGSTFEVTGITDATNFSSGALQNYHHLIWNCTGQTSIFSFGGLTTINGNLNVQSTGASPGSSSSLLLTNSTAVITTIGGNLTVSGGFFAPFGAGTANSSTLNISGNLSISGGAFDIYRPATNTGTINLAGDFSMSGGTLTKGGAGTGNFNFSKSGTQTYSKSSGTISNAINFTVNSGSTLSLGTNVLDGSTGNFTLSSGGGLETGNTAGITTAGATGSIQVSGSRTYNTGANYTFNGSSVQATGAGFTGANNLTINNSAGVTLSGNASFAGTLSLTSGAFTVGSGNTITVLNGGAISRSLGSLAEGAAAGTFTFSGSGTVNGTVGFNDVDIAGGVDFGTSSTINGTLTINSGGFVNTNAPTYSNTSTLLYHTGGTYGRGTEWSATNGAGYPNNVQISNSTTLNLGANSGTGTECQLAGNLTVDALSTLTMNAPGEVMTQSLTVKGNYINNGTTVLSGSSGGDLVLEGDLTDNNVFTANGRAIFFQGGNTQYVTSSSNPLDIDVVRINKSGGEIVLLQNLLVDETDDPIQFAGTSSILNLNGYTATFGKAGTASTITMNSTSAIKGSSTSSLSILGNGTFGSIRFDQTTPGTTNLLQNFTIDRGSSGSVSLANNLSVGGTLALTNGTLTVGANTLTYSGSSITRTSGAIDASNASATLEFTNASALTLPASLFSGNVNNLTMNGAGGVSLGSATTIAGVLTLTSGSLVVGANNLTINGSLNRTAGSIDATNNSAYVIFAGSGNTEVPISALGSNLTNLTVNKSGIVQLGGDVTVNGILTMTLGDLDIGSGNLTLGSSASVSNAGASSHILATSTGELRKIYGGSGPFTFPVGDGTNYTPATVNFTTAGSFNGETTDYLSVRLKTSKVTNMNSNNTNYINRSWFIEPHSSASGFTYTVDINYVDGDVVGTEGEIRPVKLSSGVWQYPGNVSFADGTQLSGTSGSINTTTNVLTWSGLTSFSEFGGGGQGGPLPVELTSFSTSCEEDIVSLSWSTASEQNSSHFDVEKSTDGETWRVIGTILASGNSTQNIDYSFIDSEKSSGDNYYRLNQVDIDGKNEYFGPITVSCEEDAKITTYPNPSKGEFNLVMHSKTNEKVTLKITDGNSRIICTKVIDLQNGINLFPIRENLSSGVYHIQLTSESGKTTVLKHSVY